jgi:hypothetical protein
MISIANIYKFALPGEQNDSQEKNIGILSANLREYFQSEWLIFTEETKIFSPNYSVKNFVFDQKLAKIHIFYKTGSGLLYFYPEIFCEIWIDTSMIWDAENKKRAIFFLSNIFECFEFLDEKNLMIESHSSVHESVVKRDFMQGNKKFHLRSDFIDIGHINDLTEKYNAALFESFVKEKWRQGISISEIKTKNPENYRTLLVFLYHIFSLTKNLKKTTQELQKIQKYEQENGENMHIDMSQERLQMTEKNIETVLEKYKQVFESFFDIHR